MLCERVPKQLMVFLEIVHQIDRCYLYEMFSISRTEGFFSCFLVLFVFFSGDGNVLYLSHLRYETLPTACFSCAKFSTDVSRNIFGLPKMQCKCMYND